MQGFSFKELVKILPRKPKYIHAYYLAREYLGWHGIGDPNQIDRLAKYDFEDAMEYYYSQFNNELIINLALLFDRWNV